MFAEMGKKVCRNTRRRGRRERPASAGGNASVSVPACILVTSSTIYVVLLFLPIGLSWCKTHLQLLQSSSCMFGLYTPILPPVCLLTAYVLPPTHYPSLHPITTYALPLTPLLSNMSSNHIATFLYPSLDPTPSPSHPRAP